MSDSLDKFVLQYTVDLKESISRLEELQNKIETTNKKGQESTSKLKGTFTDMKKELQPITNELAGMDGLLLRLGYRVGWLAPIMGGLFLTVKSIMDVRKEYEAQRKLGFESGMTPMGIEQFQREANKASGGIIGAEGARGIIQKTSNLAFASYTNPDVMSRESLLLSKLGTSAFGKDGGIKDTNQILDEIGNKLRSVSKETATAIGMLAGFTADEVKALRGRNQLVKDSTKIGDDEVRRLQRQNQALETIRNSMGNIQENWRRIELVVGELVMPIFDKLVEKSADFAENLQTMWQAMVDGWDDFVERFMFDLKHPFASQEEKQAAFVERFTNQILRDQKEGTNRQVREQEKAAAETRAAQALFTRDVNLFSSAVSTFAGVIDERQAWAAWAGELGKAAGVSAPATAVPTGATESTAVPGVSVAPSNYDMLYAEAAEKYGVSADVLKGITQVESGFMPNAISEAGAQGLNQIMPSNFKALGITDAFDPRQNIMGSAQLMKEYLTAAKGDLKTALTMYHGGYDRSGWGPRTRAYADKVFNAMESQRAAAARPSIPADLTGYLHQVSPNAPKPTPTGEVTQPSGSASTVNVDQTKIITNNIDASQKDVGGVKPPYASMNQTRPEGAAPYPVLSTGYETVQAKKGHYSPVEGQSREKIQLRGLQEAIAGYLGVPVEQVMQGFVNKGDVAFARKYLELGTQRDYIKNRQLADTPGVRPNIAAEAAKNARLAGFQLEAFKKYGSAIEEKARPGGRDITVGQKEITINVNGVTDPRSTAYEVRDILRQDDINDINNLTAAPTKY